jgi:hypothetical protein
MCLQCVCMCLRPPPLLVCLHCGDRQCGKPGVPHNVGTANVPLYPQAVPLCTPPPPLCSGANRDACARRPSARRRQRRRPRAPARRPASVGHLCRGPARTLLPPATRAVPRESGSEGSRGSTQSAFRCGGNRGESRRSRPGLPRLTGAAGARCWGAGEGALLAGPSFSSERPLCGALPPNSPRRAHRQARVGCDVRWRSEEHPRARRATWRRCSPWISIPQSRATWAAAQQRRRQMRTPPSTHSCCRVRPRWGRFGRAPHARGPLSPH